MFLCVVYLCNKKNNTMNQIECDGCGNYWHKYLINETEDGQNLCEHCWGLQDEDEDEVTETN